MSGHNYFRFSAIVIFFLFNLLPKFSTAQYTLEDDDVVISGGVISACVYDFTVKDIIIPDTLQNQEVIGIADAAYYNTGAFYNKGITSISFPVSLQFIGSNSFRTNAITFIDLSGLNNLEEIRSAAFIQNTATSVDLTNCSSLISIGNSAFQICDITSVDFSGCTALETIGEQAFYDNEISSLDFSSLTGLITIGTRAFFNNSISTINFSNCSSLQAINDYAFTHNSMSSIDIAPCTGLMAIGASAFTYNSITSFVLPVVTDYESNGWRNSSNQEYAGGDAATNLTASYFVPIPHVLTDEDVVVTDGVIESCSYNFASKDIIIPDTLDGQAILELKGGTSTNNGVFAGKGIFSIVLPTTLEVIQQYALYGNQLRKLDLSHCTSIREIHPRSFYSNYINTLNLDGCTALQSIGEYAFQGSSISSLDLSSCTSLRIIGERAFQNNPIASLDISGCTSLERIYDYAFYGHQLSSIDISNCTSLIAIGYYAFYGNLLTTFNLPVVSGYETLGWRDNNGVIYSGGSNVSVYNSYKVPLPYRLTDEDVVVTDSIITSCSYDFFFTDIIIPDTLDGQLVTGIADGTSSSAVFRYKNITSVQFPNTLKWIGNYTFYNNKIKGLDLSVCPNLQSVGDYAFYYNYLDSLDLSANAELETIGSYAFAGYYNTRNVIAELDLSACIKLESIGTYAFIYNSIASINFANCDSLRTIGAYAFQSNAIPSLNLSDCTSLTSLGNYAFRYNSISSLDISRCSSLMSIGTECFNNNSGLSGITLPVVTDFESNGWRDGGGNLYTGGQTATNYTTYYKVPVPYTLTDDDVVVTDGEIVSCSYNFASKDIIIPDTLDGQAVTGISDAAYSSQGIFYGKGLFTIQLPSTLERVGNYAFYYNQLSEVDFSVCTNIQNIGYQSFYNNGIDSLNFTGCTDLTTLQQHSFSYNNLVEVDLSPCSNLASIEASAFYANNLHSVNLSSCSALKIIGSSSFQSNYNLASLDLSGCDSLTTIGSNAFYNCRQISSLDLSGCPNLVTISNGAFYDNNISELIFTGCVHLKTIGQDAFRYNALTTLDLSPCDSLISIGNYSFRDNTISSIDFSNSGLLETIGQTAFYTNNLSSIDLNNCTSLTFIGPGAFAGNSMSSFVLPTHAAYGSFGWRDRDNVIYPSGTTITNVNGEYEVPYPYTLTDDDVVMDNGTIMSCSYNFAKKDIIVPDTLDGQAVTGTFNSSSYSSAVFYNKGIKTIKLPSTLEQIGGYTFYANQYLYYVDISDCSTLKSIGNYAFRSNSALPYLDFSTCPNLETIGTYVFQSCSELDSINFSGCTSLYSIGSYAFSSSGLQKIDLNNCTSLVNISSYAFAYNYNLSSIDLSVCPSLTYIGTYAFYSCGFSSFNLPSVDGFEEYGWRDGSNNSYASGASVSNLTTWYKAAIPYTLTDDDVVVTDGEIVSCSYNFAQNDIIIPDTLDGQEVIGIADAAGYSVAAFYKKNVYTVKFPSTLQKIGRYAFYDSNLKSLDLSNCLNLERINPWAFYSCALSSVSFNGCSSLRIIDQYAFRESSISSVDFTRCSALTNIIEHSFYANSISNLDLSDCTSLVEIGNRAFYLNNALTEFELPVVTGYETYGWRDGNGNEYMGGDTVSNTNTSYEVPLPYTLTDDDVVVTNGIITSCSYNFAKTDIIVPDTLDNQFVKHIGSNVFNSKGITSIQLPDSIETIGVYAFYTNSLYDLDFTRFKKLWHIADYAFTTNTSLSADLSQCSALNYIGKYAFNNTATSSFVLPVNTEYEYLGWVDQNGTTYAGGTIVSNKTIWYKVPIPYTLTDDDVVVTDGVIVSCSYNFATKDIIIPDTLDGQAVNGIAGNSSYTSAIFYNKGITSVQFPEHLEYIGKYAFYFNPMSKADFSGCNSLISIEQSAFYNNSIRSLDLSNCPNLTTIGTSAFSNNSITSLDLSGCTSLQTIANSAFNANSLPSVDLSTCNNLIFIGSYAFNSNSLSSFTLPTHQLHADLGWRDEDWNFYSGGETVSNLYKSYKVPFPYTLTDDDVAVVNGEITSCSYSFETKDIIIPDTLDGQFITGIASASSAGYGIFYSKGITSLQLPSGLINLGNYAFYYNEIFDLQITGNQIESIGKYTFASNNLDSLDLSGCTSLLTIDDYAFNYNSSLSSLNLSGCTQLTTIGNNAFYYCSITELDLSSCSNLTSIEQYAFNNNSITTLNLSGCTKLEYIGDRAFLYNEINGVDLSSCKLLISIGTYAFYGNNITGFRLPKTNVPGYILSYWKDNYDNQYSGGDFVPNLDYSYTAVLSHAILANFHVSNGTNPLEDASVEVPGFDTVQTDVSGLAQLTVMSSDSIGYTAQLAGYLTIHDSIRAQDSVVNEYIVMQSCADSIWYYESICNGETYSFMGSIYSESGIFQHNYTNKLGCDSVIILDLTVNPEYNVTSYDTICAGNSSVFGDTIYTETGTYTQTFSTISGCDSIVTLELLVYPSDSVIINKTICEGDFYLTADSTQLTESGSYIENLSNYFGCDSVVTINLKVLPTVTPLTKLICEGEEFAVGQSVYTETGSYSDTLLNTLGCDSIINLELTVIPQDINLTMALCDDDSVVIGNSIYKQTGVYTDTLLNKLGCDSIINLDLTINRSDSVHIDQIICEGESMNIGDSIYTQTGEYLNTLTNRFGCDSIVSLNLKVNPVYEFITNEEICEGDDYLFQGNYYNIQGTYTDTFSTINGCDSIYTLNLTVNPADRVVFKDTITGGDTYVFRGENYTSSGFYSDSLINQSGCDSIISLLLYVYYEPVVFIPDSLFKAELLNNTLINTNKDDEIQVTEANNYTGSINVTAKNISRFTGIEAFANIDSLWCGSNSGDTLDLTANTNLIFVDCSNNLLEHIQIENLPNLSELRCSGNQLTQLSTSSLNGLEILNCNNNDLLELDFSQNTNLSELNCSNNALNTLNLRNGNNMNMSVLSTNNSNLTCVSVDDVEWANMNWNTLFDEIVLFSTDCSAPDIAVQNISFVPVDVYPEDFLNVNWEVINFGNGDAIGGWNERISLVSLDNKKLYLNGNLTNNATILATDTVKRSATLQIPSFTTFSGQAYVMVELVPTGELINQETITANNKLKSDSTVHLQEVLKFDIEKISVFENSKTILRGQVSHSGNADSALIILLSTSSNDLNIPASVEIPSGSNASNFTFTLNDNSLFDGIRVIEIEASASGFDPANDYLEILDDDIPSLSIVLEKDTCSEGESITATISSDLKLDTAQTILLSNDKTGQLLFDSPVIIPADDSLVQISIGAVDDSKPEHDVRNILRVSSNGYLSGKDTIVLLDNDIPDIELELLTDTISESAGENATWLRVSRSADSDITISIALSTLSSEIDIPEYVHFFPGEMEKLADIDVTDNDMVDGFRAISINGSVHLPSCNCPSTIAGTDTSLLVLADDDGPALQISCDPVVLAEGQVNQGTLTITKNTPDNMTLLVHLATNLPGELHLQDTVSIPAGSSSVEVPVYALNDSTDDGQQTVVIKASALNYSPGTFTVYTSDQNKPDLIVSSFTPADDKLTIGSSLEFQATIKNTGFLKAPAGFTANLYLSSDNKLGSTDQILQNFTLEESLAIGDSLQIWDLVNVPASLGNYYLLLKVNPNETLTELFYTNNTSQAVPFEIQSNYSATAVVDETTFSSAQPVTIYGSAIMTDSTAAINKNVEVYVITQGIRRTIDATTNDSGEYSVLFEPYDYEVGHYIVGACYPGENSSAIQDEFDILGFGTTSGDWLTWYVQKGETITGSFSVKNYSNAELTGLTLNFPQIPNGLDIQVNTIATLAGNETANFNFSVTGNEITPGLDYIKIPVIISTDQGVTFEFTALYFCQAKEGLLKTEPMNLETSFTKGKTRYIEFLVYNIGAGNSGEVRISLPDLDWMSLASSATIENIAAGDYSKVTLRLQSVEETPLNYPMTGQIAINATNSDGLALPYRIECVSEETGNLLVDVVDEYTYNTQEAPHVANAQVTVTNPYTGAIVAEGLTDANGLFEYTGLPEGTYILQVQADKHDGFRTAVTIDPGRTTDELIFISFQAITYNWTVVPTEIEDEYEIVLELVYETNVPMPVVAIDMPQSMPELEGDETYSFMVTLTNKGLITAEDVDLDLPDDDPEYEFIYLDKKHQIAAKESVQIPVTFQRRTSEKSASLGDEILTMNSEDDSKNCTSMTIYAYGWKCGDDNKWERVTYPITFERCTSDDQSGEEYFSDATDDDAWEAINTIYNALDAVSVPSIFNTVLGQIPTIPPSPTNVNSGSGTYDGWLDTDLTGSYCNPCYDGIASALAGCAIDGTAGKIISALGCLRSILMVDFSTQAVRDCVLGFTPAGCANGVVSAIETCYKQYKDVFNENKSALATSTDIPPVIEQAYNDLLYFEAAYQATVEWSDEFWKPIKWQEKIYISEFADAVAYYIDNKIPFSETAIDSIVNEFKILDFTEDEMLAYMLRWNSTLQAWEQNIYSPDSNFPDIIDNDILDYAIWKTDSVNSYVQSQGASDLYDLYQNAYGILEEEMEANRNSVCASVSLSISQKLVMTREAFRGTLTLNNGHETMAIEEFELNLEIKNLQGDLCNDLFEIETESLSQLTAINGTGVLPALETGTATILFIPEKGAAPTITRSYSFGGSITYLDPFTSTTVTKTLFPVILEVHPSPDLYLHYFMQRDILGDDPLTPDILEPVIPGELALMIENKGYGDAKNILIESAQPEITDNEKGLLIDFELIGSNLQGVPVELGLINIDFGTVPAQHTRIGQWWFTSSLLGHFVNYAASLTHSDSRGNPELSLISGAEMHELIKSISVYGDLDDGIQDFLVNDIPDIKENPDAIYLSQGQTILDVYEASGGSFDQDVKSPTFTNTLTVVPRFEGWNYLRLDDPGNGLFEIESITRNNDSQQIPLDNAWLTYITMPDGEEHFYENKFHIADEFETMAPQTYTIVWTPADTSTIEVVEITGAPAQQVTLPLTELTVVFNKEIDPSSFTYEDISLQLEGGSNLADNSIGFTQLNDFTYKLDISGLTSGDGTYQFTVNTINISDNAENTGTELETVSWIQLLSIPAIEEFSGILSDPTNQIVDAIQLRFNMEIDPTTFSADDLTLYKNSGAAAASLTVSQVDGSYTTFLVEGISGAIAEDATYQLLVDLDGIRSLTGIYGENQQYEEWTYDSASPEIISFAELSANKLDEQHVPALRLTFSEAITALTGSDVELWKNNVLLNTSQVNVSSVTETIWNISGFDTLTYGEGSYLLKILFDQVSDAAGNPGNLSNNTYTWQVDRTPPPAVTNILVVPDLGVSNNDRITSGDSIFISMLVHEDNTTILLYETDGGSQTLLAQKDSVDSGLLVIPVEFSATGNISAKIVCVDSVDNKSSVTFSLYLDNSDLQATISGAPTGISDAHPDSLIVTFSEAIFTSDFDSATISIKYNGSEIKSNQITIDQLDTKQFVLKGFENLLLRDGIHTMYIDLGLIRKLSSAKTGSSKPNVTWEIQIPNSYPVANAGADSLVRQGQNYQLNGLATYDADGDPLTYKWYYPSSLILSEENTLTPSFVVPFDKIGTSYMLMLSASDGELTHTDKTIITINQAIVEDTVSVTICSNESYQWGSLILNEPGTYIDTLPTSSGADSIVHLNLYVNPADSIVIDSSICEGESIVIGDSVYSETGIYITTFNNQFGCDSIVTLDLTVYPHDSISLIQVLCEGEFIEIGDSVYYTTGVYVTKLSNQLGCDSVVTLDLTVNLADSSSITQMICEGEHVAIGDSVYSETGVFVTTLSNQLGCDSVVTLNLKVNPTDSTLVTQMICEGEQVAIGDSVYSETGVFVTTLSNQLGCDSVITLYLNRLESDTTEIVESICYGDSFLIDTISYDSTGIYYQTFIGDNGCDSIVELNLTVLPESYRNISATICSGDSYSLNDSISYSIEGTYSHTFKNSNGCDSLVVLSLSVNENVTTDLDVSICTGESYEAGGKTHSTSGTYIYQLVSAAGCDSTVTLNLTVVDNTEEFIEAEICENESLVIGGTEYSEQGIYEIPLSGSNGCDSIVHLDLVVHSSDTTILFDTISKADAITFNSQVLDSSGIYEAQLSNRYGCDSIVQIYLTVIPNQSPYVMYQPEDLYLEVGDSVYLSWELFGTLFFDEDDSVLNYEFSASNVTNDEWISSSFYQSNLELILQPGAKDTGCIEFILSASDSLGEMAEISVMVCVSDQITGLENLILTAQKFKVYPNPSSGIIFIDFEQQLQENIEVFVYTITGKQIFKKEYHAPLDAIQLNLQNQVSGVYLVNLKLGDKVQTKRIILNNKKP